MRKSVQLLMVCLLAVTVAASAARAQEGPDEDAKSRVTLDWNTFRELTKYERPDAQEPVIKLPWDEVQDMLGVEVQGAGGAQLSLNWMQFKALLKWSVERKKPKETPLPADYVVASSDFTGTLHEGGAVFELAMRVNVIKEEGWQRIPLLPASVAIEEAVLPDDCYLNVHGGHYELLTTKSGWLDIKVKFAVAVTEQAGAHLVRFATMPSGACVLKLTVPRENVDVKVAGAQAVLPMEAKKGETVVGAALPSGAPVSITWERALAAVEPAEPKIYAETGTLVAVGEGILTCRERISLNVLHAGVRSVTLSVPKQVNVLEVSGSAVHDWRAVKDAVEVRFTREVIGNALLSLVYEYAAPVAEDTKTDQPEVPVLRVREAVREKGYIAVVAVANVEIAAPVHAGATGVDARELPPEILHMTGQPVLLAFRYAGKEFNIKLLVKKHEDVAVLLTIADSAVLTIMQTADGRRITKAIYNVRNNRNQFLRMKLPEGAEIWSATVAGKSVRPAMDEGKNVLMPLVRSGGRMELTSFPVEIVYVQSQKDIAAKGSMRIDLPAAGQPVTHLMAQLYLPAEGSYKTGLWGKLSFEGPLRRVDAFSHIASAPRPPQPQVDAANQAEQLQRAAVRRQEAKAVAAGVTPIRVRLPVRGQLFRFEKILVIDEPLHIDFQYSGWDKE